MMRMRRERRRNHSYKIISFLVHQTLLEINTYLVVVQLLVIQWCRNKDA